MFELVREMPSFKLNGGYITDLFNSKYDAAFEEAYQMGGRRSSAKFDDTQFVEKLFDEMYSQAQKDGKGEIAKDIAGLKVDLVRMMRAAEQLQ